MKNKPSTPQSTIQVIIQDAYKRTQRHFEKQQAQRLAQIETFKKRMKDRRRQPIVVVDDVKRPITPPPPEPPVLNIHIEPLIELQCETFTPIERPIQAIEYPPITIECVLKTQTLLSRERREERKTAQKDQFQYYESLNQEDKLAALDNQIDETFCYTYQIPSHKQQQIEIMYIDFTKLNHLVNDTIINFFLRFVQHEILDRQQQFKIFSTYHTAKIVPYENILQVSSQAELAEEFGRNFQTILKWTKDDIFNCPYILFPLHLKEHWSLMVVYDAVSICRAMIEGTPQQGGFIYLDSLQILDEKILFLLKIFLLQIYCRQFGIQLSHAQILKSIKNSNVPCYQPLITRQINYIDCGVHLLEYAESFMAGPREFVERVQGPKGWHQLRWFPRIMVLTKRLLIKRLLLNLVRYPKEYAVATYIKERYNLYQEFKDKASEYDVFDEADFAEYAAERTGPKQMMRLDFYLNEEHNFYFQD